MLGVDGDFCNFAGSFVAGSTGRAIAKGRGIMPGVWLRSSCDAGEVSGMWDGSVGLIAAIRGELTRLFVFHRKFNRGER
jgi:hypothetical protein